MRSRRSKSGQQPQTQAELTAHNMGVLMRSQGVAAEFDDDAVMLFLADHWTPDDMAAFDNMGADAYMSWVDRGYAGK